ncbi:MAG: succinylglutamate desuccinylase/aspartoacylase family protein [Desulfuromonas sp.]|nr:succinylglutamate desuccinylase/aspartoacylase family protein [Desulfuromonas sp.]
MANTLTIDGIEIKAGETRTIALQLPRLYDATEMVMPVHVFRGKRPGPTLFVSAAIHGDEINGVEIVRRLIKLKTVASLRGTLIAIPLVNVYGFLNRSRYLPDHRDLNRAFPGSEGGSLAARVAFRFMEQIVSKCTHGIDLHSGSNNRQNLPQIRCSWQNDAALNMAKAFAAPLIVHSKLRDSSLREAVNELNIPILVYEAGEALRFDESAIRGGVKGVVAVMRHLNMLPPRRQHQLIEPLVSRKTAWVRSPVSGLLTKSCKLGAIVEKDATLGYIEDPMNDKRQPVKASHAGVVMGIQNLPLVYQGDALFHIATVAGDEEDQADSLEAFQELVEDYI